MLTLWCVVCVLCAVCCGLGAMVSAVQEGSARFGWQARGAQESRQSWLGGWMTRGARVGKGDARGGECAGRVPRTSTHAHARAVAVARCYFYAYR